MTGVPDLATLKRRSLAAHPDNQNQPED